MIKKEEALQYHSMGRRGKIEVTPTKPCVTQRDLALAYTPGVAIPCLEIEKNPSDAYLYTAKGNLVAVISNGTAVLGLGDIGALAGKPVMEGKGVLFKRFADIDVFDIELNTKDPLEVIRTCQILEPTFGGINLEDIKAPECFQIEEELKKTLTIPVFHDDQHGTAIISAAALLNALELCGKDIAKIRVVFSGAGAAGIACAKLYLSLGVKIENVLMVDSKGVMYEGRDDKWNKYKQQFVRKTDIHTLEAAMKDADVFVGVSAKDVVTKDMVKSMAKDPIIFAMANPDPEITYPDAVSVRKDLIMATGRSDYPNQVNNVLGFPFIFRGALDVGATAINEEMKIAAVRALANLAKEDVPDSVARAYGVTSFKFGREYIIPKPFDPRVLIWEASAVAKAAMDSGVARKKVDIEEYKHELEHRLGLGREIRTMLIERAKKSPKRVVFSEGTAQRILRAAMIVKHEGFAQPIVLGNETEVRKVAAEGDIDLTGIEIVHPHSSPNYEKYVKEFFRLRHKKGVTLDDAKFIMRNPNYFGAMMVHMGDCDAFLAGVTQQYPETIRPALEIIGKRDDLSIVSGLFVLIIKNKLYFFSDTTVNITPTAEQLVEITLCCAEAARRFGISPKIALLSFSNFGSVKHPEVSKVQDAVRILHREYPDMIVDGDMQADTATDINILRSNFPFSKLQDQANVFIFPDLSSANIAYKLMIKLGGAEAIGPILMGMKKPVHVLHRSNDVDQVVVMAALATAEAGRAAADQPNLPSKVKA
ncbi:MAG: NADP-dependent malic enzyme [bacterium]|nr:NADP-dependent malic enzyme [bacterium]